MSNVPVYMVVNLKVTNAETYKKYEKGFFQMLKKYEGQFITFDDSPDTLEGLAPREGRIIMFQFPSEEKARAWYANSDYQALAEHRRAGTQLEFLTMVRGMPARG